MYTSIDTFVQDLPGIAARLENRMKGHSGAFSLTLDDGRIWFARLNDGKLELCGELPACDCAVRTKEQIVLDLVNGKLNPVKAILFGKLKVSGNVKKLLELAALAV